MKIENKDYKKLYEEALERAKYWAEGKCMEDFYDSSQNVLNFIFPETKESEDEKIRKWLINEIKIKHHNLDEDNVDFVDKALAWLEKQGTPAKLSEEERNRFSKGVLSDCAISFINYLDSHKKGGKMCVSNGECEDIENAFHNGMWDRLHEYHCKYIEKQDEQKPNPYSGTSFEYNGHTWGMCARDYGVEILIDSNLKAFVSLDKTETYHLIPNKITPKFKAGDWVINEHGFVMQIVDVQDSWYVYMYEGKGLSATIKQMENSCHLWTIQDAKDGDVLVTRLSPEGDWTGIYKQSTETNGFNTYCFCNSVGEFVINPNRCRNHGTYGLHPATKEQRDFLFAKMKEVGYEWDAEDKVLKKIKQKPNFCHHEVDLSDCSEEYRKAYYDGWNNCNQQHAQLEAERKPAWSEEDEKQARQIKRIVHDAGCAQKLQEQIADWLKFLKDRITLTNKNNNDLKKL